MKYLKKYEERGIVNKIFNYDFPDWELKTMSGKSFIFKYKYNDIEVEILLQGMIFISWFDDFEEDEECIGECAFRVVLDNYEYETIKKLLDFSIIFKESYLVNELLNRNNIKTRIEFFSPKNSRTLEELEEIVKKVDELKVKYDYILNSDNLGLL